MGLLRVRAVRGFGSPSTWLNCRAIAAWPWPSRMEAVCLDERLAPQLEGGIDIGHSAPRWTRHADLVIQPERIARGQEELEVRAEQAVVVGLLLAPFRAACRVVIGQPRSVIQARIAPSAGLARSARRSLGGGEQGTSEDARREGVLPPHGTRSFRRCRSSRSLVSSGPVYVGDRRRELAAGSEEAGAVFSTPGRGCQGVQPATCFRLERAEQQIDTALPRAPRRSRQEPRRYHGADRGSTAAAYTRLRDRRTMTAISAGQRATADLLQRPRYGGVG